MTTRENGRFVKGSSGNPSGRPPAKASGEGTPTFNIDGWSSFLTGIGNEHFDKRMSHSIVVEPVSDEEAQMIYRADWLGARGIDIWPKHMFREGFDISISEAGHTAKTKAPSDADELAEAVSNLSPVSRQDARGRKRADAKRARSKLRLDAAAAKLIDLSEKSIKVWKDLKGKEVFKKALAFARAYGGGGVLIGARDGAKDWMLPLKPEAIRSIDFLTPLEARELTPMAWYDDPLAAKFGEVKLWQITPVTPVGAAISSKPIYVHETRVIHFKGIEVARNQSSPRVGHGDSWFTRVKPVLRDYNVGWSSAAILTQDFAQAVFKIKGLAEMVTKDAQKKLLARMMAVELGRSVAKCTLIDKDEEFARQTTNLTGLPELLNQFCYQIAAAYNTPVSLLFGIRPGGLSDTGDSDVRNFYDEVAAEQEDTLEPALRRVFSLILRTLNGNKEPEKWCIEFKPLWQETPKEKAETRWIHMQTDEKAILNGIYTAAEARRSRYGGEKYGEEITIDDQGEGDDFDPPPGALEDHKAAMNGAANANESAPPAGGSGATPVPGKSSPAGAGPTDPNALPESGTDKPNVGIPTDPAAAPGQTPTAPMGQLPIAAPEKPISNAVLNGAQIAQALAIAAAVANKEIDRLAGKTIIMLSFPVDDATAENMLGSPTFEPVKPPAPAFGGGGFGAKPGAPIPSGKEGEEKPAEDAKPAAVIPSGKEEEPKPPVAK